MYNKIGFDMRLSRIINPYSGRTIIVSLDQGLMEGAVKGLSPIISVVKIICHSGPEAVILSPGSVSYVYEIFKGKKRPALILRIDVVNLRKKGEPGYSEEIYHTGIISPLESLKIGVDAVVCFFFAGHRDFVLEGEMVQHLSECSYRCRELGLPLIAEVVPVNADDEYDPEIVKFAVRIASELGADLIATNYTGDVDSFSKVIEQSSVPIFVRGMRDINSDEDFFSILEGIFDAGAKGVMLGKEVFQAENPMKMVRALSAVIHEEKSVQEAMDILRG